MENASYNTSYLTFKLGEEVFAAGVDHVLEILELPRITRVPRAPEFMRGVINLRGNVLSVIDIRAKFGLSDTADTINTCIIVIQVTVDGEEARIGALVDAVHEVIEVGADTIQPPPTLAGKSKSDFIKGMIKMNEQFIMLLDVNKVFDAEEIAVVQETEQTSL